jgi:hypothetical protein
MPYDWRAEQQRQNDLRLQREAARRDADFREQGRRQREAQQRSEAQAHTNYRRKLDQIREDTGRKTQEEKTRKLLDLPAKPEGYPKPPIVDPEKPVDAWALLCLIGGFLAACRMFAYLGSISAPTWGEWVGSALVGLVAYHFLNSGLIRDLARLIFTLLAVLAVIALVVWWVVHTVHPS